MRYILLASILLLGACGKKKTAESSATPAAPKNQVTLTDEQVKTGGIVSGLILKQDMRTELVVNGVADVPPQNIVSVSFPLGGYLKGTRLLPGMRVRRGEVIATVEDQALIQLQQDYLITKARLDFLTKDYERQRLLNESKVNSDKVFQQTASDFQSQKILLKGYAEKLQLVGINPSGLNENNISRSISIVSPINGYVSKVNVNIGKYVTPSEVLFELINPSDIHAALTVFEKDLVTVSPGQRVMVTLVDDPRKEYEAEVILITRNVDEESRSALIHCHFEENPQHLLPGMFLRARIQVNRAAAMAVPEDAVVRQGNEEFLVENTGPGTYALLPVTTGIRYQGMVEVSSRSGDLSARKVVTRNAYPVFAEIRKGSE